MRSGRVHAATPSGRLRGLASVIGHGSAVQPGLPPLPHDQLVPGRVASAGTWADETVHRALADLLGRAVAHATGAFE